MTVSAEDKWRAFQARTSAIAASGTVLLELALARVPVVSCYKLDWIARLMTREIKTWTAALPNLIADYAVIPEYLDEVVRPGSLARWAMRLSHDTAQRRAMLEGFDLVHARMQDAQRARRQGGRCRRRPSPKKKARPSADRAPASIASDSALGNGT